MLLMKRNLKLRRLLKKFKMLLPLPKRIWKSNKPLLIPPSSTKNQLRRSKKVRLKLRSKKKSKQRKPLLRNSSQRSSKSHGVPHLRSGLLTCQSTTSHSANRKKARSRPLPKMRRKMNLSPRTNPRTKTLVMSPTNE